MRTGNPLAERLQGVLDARGNAGTAMIKHDPLV